MDWEIIDIEMKGEVVELSGKAEINLDELQSLLEGQGKQKSKKVVITTKKKRSKKALKRTPNSLKHSEYMRKYHAKKRAEKEAAEEKPDDEPDDDVSDEKLERMEKANKKLRKLEERTHEIPERP